MQYKSFVEAAIFLNDELENLNVLVNLVQNTIIPAAKSCRFSVYRLLLNVWQNEVKLPIFYDGSAMARIYKHAANEFANSLFIDFALREDPLKLMRRFSSFDAVKAATFSQADTELTLEDEFVVRNGNSYLVNASILDFDSEDFRSKYLIEQLVCNLDLIRAC